MAASPAEQLRRIRKDLARPRRAPLRLLIASDTRRPMRALVIPRGLPLAIAIVVGERGPDRAGSSLTSWHRGATVDALQGRLGR